MGKQRVIMEEIITQYHPLFVNNSELLRIGLQHPEMFAVERLLEDCLAHAGGYTKVDLPHADFDDIARSDSKTGSIRIKGSKSNNSYAGEISGVTTPNGTAKAGSLRCVIYNPHTSKLMYYYLPKWFWSTLINRHPTSGVGRIMFTYNMRNDSIKKLDEHKCSSFEELACKM